MPEIHQARRRRAQEMVGELGADAVLITHGPNVRYLTGLASSNAALLLPADGAGVLATDSRYALAAQRDAPDLELIIDRFIEASARRRDGPPRHAEGRLRGARDDGRAACGARGVGRGSHHGLVRKEN